MNSLYINKRCAKLYLFVYAGPERDTKEALILPDTTGPPDSKVEL
jgi:hypothetical protein